MGDINPSKMPTKKIITRKDDPNKVAVYKKGGKVGLYENIHKKQERIAAGSGEKMRSVGTKGAPTNADFIKSAKTAKGKK
jgi:hypothetical protein